MGKNLKGPRKKEGASKETSNVVAAKLLKVENDSKSKSRDLTDSEVALLKKKMSDGLKAIKNHPWNKGGSSEKK